MVADIEVLEEMDVSEIYAKRLIAKEVLTPMNGEKYIFPIADGTVKLTGGDQVPRTSTLIRDRPDRVEEQGKLQGESDGSSSTLGTYGPRSDQQQKGEERIVARSKPTTMNLAVSVSRSSSTVNSPIASKSHITFSNRLVKCRET